MDSIEEKAEDWNLLGRRYWEELSKELKSEA